MAAVELVLGLVAGDDDLLGVDNDEVTMMEGRMTSGGDASLNAPMKAEAGFINLSGNISCL